MQRKAKIVCTIGNVMKKVEEDLRRVLSETITDGNELGRTVKKRAEERFENELRKTICAFIESGMNVARINMAHYDCEKKEDKRYLERLIQTIRHLSGDIAIMGDIQGPKVRINDFLGVCEGKGEVEVRSRDTFVLTTKTELPNVMGASIKKPEFLDFIGDVRQNRKDPSLPIEFWFADGEVILEADEDDIRDHDTEIYCRVKVPGTMRRNKGISVKNSRIRPGKYELRKYPKDEKDIRFLLEQGIDLIAMSLVNTRDDVESLQSFIRSSIEGVGRAKEIAERFYVGMRDFPIISKIETEEGFLNIDEILNASYGIMVARGDLALQTRIQDIPILQKRIIEKCVLKGKPVITATQMLSWMVNFIEPKRAEATDVANAIFDGTDALMLSEETADPKSKFPTESIRMMAEIALAAEEEMRKRNTLEYRYKIDQLHEKIMRRLGRDESALETGLRREDTEGRVSHTVSYSACEKAFELDCKAIIVLTETGRTARMLSTFKPDATIVAGVYSDSVGRLLHLSYGVIPITVARNDRGYPFEEFKDVTDKAKERKLVQTGDRVLTVGRYPRRESGTVTFVNVSTVE